jgi:hypothetical protein
VNRAKRRRDRRDRARQASWDHGHSLFVFDSARRRIVRQLDPHARFDPFAVVWPDLDDEGALAFMPGMCDRSDIFGWACEMLDGFPMVRPASSRVLISACCEHVRDAEAERLSQAGIDVGTLPQLFAQHPQQWFAYGLVPVVPEVGA